MTRSLAALLALLTALPAFAVPTNFAFTQVPSRFSSRELTFSSRAQGEICWSRSVMPDGSICNPAALAEVNEGSLLGRMYVGNGYQALNTANNFLFKPLSREFLEDLFKKDTVTSLELNAGLVFTAPHFSAEFSPYRIQYMSEVHNPNLPVIAVHSALERSMSFASGVPITGVPGLSAGARLKLLERRYVHGSFSFLQLATESPSDFLPVKKQRAMLLDPSVSWKASFWKPVRPTFSLAVENIGKTWPDDALYPESTDVDLGFGIEPSVKYGTLHLGMDLVNLANAPDLARRVRLGGGYHLGAMELLAGANRDVFSAGLQFGIQVVQAGIVYEFARTEMEGDGFENRIATEFSIRL